MPQKKCSGMLYNLIMIYIERKKTKNNQMQIIKNKNKKKTAIEFKET